MFQEAGSEHGSVEQQLELIPVAWECQGEQEQPQLGDVSRAGGEGSWIRLVGITSCCSWESGLPGLGLPSHYVFFPEFFYGS